MAHSVTYCLNKQSKLKTYRMKKDRAELHLEKRYFRFLVIYQATVQYHTTLKVEGSYGLGLIKKVLLFFFNELLFLIARGNIN